MTEDERWAAWRLMIASRRDPQAVTVLALVDAFCTPQPPLRVTGVGHVGTRPHEIPGVWAGRPTCIEMDEVYALIWSYADIPDKTFSIEVRQDGRIEWFFHDRTTDTTDGTEEDPVDWIPPIAVEYLMQHWAC